MIAETLQRLIDQGVTSAKEVSELTGVAASTVYRWIAGQSQPDVTALRMLIRHLPHQRGQEALLTALLAGTPWHVVHQAPKLDFNADGKIDADDALSASIESVRSASDALHRLRQSLHDHRIEPKELHEVLHVLSDVTRHCHIVQQIVTKLGETEKKR